MNPRNSAAILLLLAASLAAQTRHMPSKLIIVDPGHFHATLLQKDMYPWVDPRVTVYAPLGPDLLDYLNRISLFNSRPANPTRWALDVHTGGDPMAEMLQGHAGNIVVFTGRNRGKIDRILAALKAGLNVLADKPWIITPADLPKLEEALALARQKNLAAYDIMTERYEVTSELQREFVNDRTVFGTLEKGTAAEPAVRARSIHHIMKVVAGTPLRRPPWFFDIEEYGEGLADVGTHVVDLVQWTAFPGEALDYRRDIAVLAGRRWPLPMSKEQFASPATRNSRRRWALTFTAARWTTTVITRWRIPCAVSTWNWRLSGTGRRPPAAATCTRPLSAARNRASKSARARPNDSSQSSTLPARMTPWRRPWSTASPRYRRVGRASPP